MQKTILLGQDRQIVTSSSEKWEQNLAAVPQDSLPRLSFMTYTHHWIRYFAVRELVKSQKPLSSQQISRALNIPQTKVENVLDELEQKLFFLVRNELGEVVWAYPFTVESTAHALEFSSGERLYAA